MKSIVKKLSVIAIGTMVSMTFGNAATELDKVMKDRGLSQSDLLAAAKTYTPSGGRDKYLVFSSGGQSGHISVKAMMQVYRNEDYFLRHKQLEDKIANIYVQDYLTQERVDATKAFYMFGSRLVGPHGDDLIPFKSQESAELFKLKHGGTKILAFDKLSKGLIRYLDM